MGQANEPTVDNAWDAYTSGAETPETTDAEVDTESLLVDEQVDETTADDDSPDEPESTDDFQSIRSEMAALKKQFEQERTQYQEMLRRAQQSMRSVGDSIVERVEQRLAQAAPAYVDLVKSGYLTAEDAQARLATLRGQFTSEEAQRSQQERAHADRQAWLAQQPQTQPQPTGQYNPQEVQYAQTKIAEMVKRSGLTDAEIKAYGVPSDFSHLSPIEAVDSVQRWLVATMKIKQAQGGQVPAQRSVKQFPYGDMGGGAGVAARGMEGVSSELQAELAKANPNFQRIQELSDALEKQLPR